MCSLECFLIWYHTNFLMIRLRSWIPRKITTSRILIASSQTMPGSPCSSTRNASTNQERHLPVLVSVKPLGFFPFRTLIVASKFCSPDHTQKIKTKIQVTQKLQILFDIVLFVCSCFIVFVLLKIKTVQMLGKNSNMQASTLQSDSKLFFRGTLHVECVAIYSLL